MKAFGGFLLVVGLLSAAFLLTRPTQASAVGCANVSSFGAVQLSIPELPRTGEYRLWLRMQSPVSTGTVQVETNQAYCFTIQDTTFLPNQWKWVTYQPSDGQTALSFTNKLGNTMLIIGTQDGVRVDQVLITDLGCIPQDYGNNCSQAVVATVNSQSDITQLPPPSDGSVSGDIMLSTTPLNNLSQLAQVTYSVNGRILQQSPNAVLFDTTLLADGKYTVLIETKFKDGAVLRESTVIAIDNPNNALSPVIRWLRLNQQSLVVVGGAILGLVLFFIIGSMLRSAYTRHRYRKFHGF
jgi:hypothetical protein